MGIRQWILAGLCSGFFFASTLAWSGSELETRCYDHEEPVGWSYCVYRTVGSENPDILYHLHGRSLNHELWGEREFYSTLIRKEWDAIEYDAPVVVSISFGPAWLLVAENSSPQSGLFEVMTETVLPAIEEELGEIEGRRFFLGESMGGFNVTQLLFHAPGLVDRAAILCPPYSLISHFAEEREIEDFLDRTGADPDFVESAIEMSREYMPEMEDWVRASPLRLAETLFNEESPPIYLSCGYYDEFGFFEGSERFAEIAKERGAPIEWRPQLGGHCAADLVSLARFFARE